MNSDSVAVPTSINNLASKANLLHFGSEFVFNFTPKTLLAVVQ